MKDQRRHLYTDQKLQGYFLFGLIVMEFLLTGLLLYFLYFKINIIIEDHLYKAHSIDASSWPDIFALLAVAMSIFVVINLLALYIAHVIWNRYVNQTISIFSSVLDKIISLDFSDAPTDKHNHHRIIDLMKQWYQHEKQRGQDISLVINKLSKYENIEITHDDRESIRQVLDDYRRLLIGR